MFALVSINGCTSFLANYKKMKSVSRYLHNVNILFTNKIGKKNSNYKFKCKTGSPELPYLVFYFLLSHHSFTCQTIKLL